MFSFWEAATQGLNLTSSHSFQIIFWGDLLDVYCIQDAVGIQIQRQVRLYLYPEKNHHSYVKKDIQPSAL